MAVTNEGINSLLNTFFKGAAQVTTWYTNVFCADYTPVIADTAATFPGLATEATTQITEGTRQALTLSTSTAKSLGNTANLATVTAAVDFVAYGAGVYSSATKGGVAGVLFCAAKFPSSRSLKANDQLKIEVIINGASA
jgi:hypothetical protein